MSTLKNIALVKNKTVVASIHQPSSQMFFMFDKLLLLCNGQVGGQCYDTLELFEIVHGAFILDFTQESKRVKDEQKEKRNLCGTTGMMD